MTELPWTVCQSCTIFFKTDESEMNGLRLAFGNLSIGKQFLQPQNGLAVSITERFYHSHDIPTPKPPGFGGPRKQYRRYILLDIRLCFRSLQIFS